MTAESLLTKYRPAEFAEVLGNTSQISALKRAMDGDSPPHAFLFTGPSGVGKTTLARIVAAQLKASVDELDAASHSGVDAVRAFLEDAQFQGMRGTGRRLFLLDECHRFSGNAWDALLKIVEEPPAHLYFALCTTAADKVPETIKTRCFHVALRAVEAPDIEELLDFVAEAEGWTVVPEVRQHLVVAATGQPRKALALLMACHDYASAEEVARVVALQEAGSPLIQALQLVISGRGKIWPQVRECLLRVDTSDAEQAFIGAGRYLTTVLLRTEDPVKAARIWILLDALTFPSGTFDRYTGLMAAIGRMLWGGENK